MEADVVSKEEELEILRQRIEEALWELEPVRTLGNLLELQVLPDGTVEIRGPVRSRVIRDAVVARLRDVEGVRQVVDGIIPDPDLEIAVARALMENERTKGLRPGMVSVRAHHGVITLLGRLPPEISRQGLVEVVRAVPGVRGVVDKLAN
jgi:osmotically-inducible protein OsmY